MYSYRTVERALTHIHGDTGAAALRIRSRIKHFIRLGFTPESPGKGKRISYTLVDVMRWAYALQILEYGLDPIAAQSVVEQSWERVRLSMSADDDGKNDILIATPRAISHPDTWAGFDFMIISVGSPAYGHVSSSLNFFRQMRINLSLVGRYLRNALDEAEAGTLRDLSEEIEQVKASGTRTTYIEAAFANWDGKGDLSIGGPNGRPLVEQIDEDGAREVTPDPRRSTRASRPAAQTQADLVKEAHRLVPPGPPPPEYFDATVSSQSLVQAEEAAEAKRRQKAPLDVGTAPVEATAPKRRGRPRKATSEV